MTTVLLDSHVVHWWSAEPERLSRRASRAISAADELAVASISWFELAWLARHERIAVTMPTRSWLEEISEQVRTVGITPAIAAAAVALPASFPSDPADRLIYAKRDRARVPARHERSAAPGAPSSPIDHGLVEVGSLPGYCCSTFALAAAKSASVITPRSRMSSSRSISLEADS